MPKVYISQEERRKDAYRRRIKKLIVGKMAELGIKQKELAQLLGLSEGGISIAISHGSLSLIQMIQLDEILHFDEHDLKWLFTKEG